MIRLVLPSKRGTGGSKNPAVRAILSARGRSSGKNEKGGEASHGNKETTKATSIKKQKSWFARLSRSKVDEKSTVEMTNDIPPEERPDFRVIQGLNPRDQSILDHEHEGPWIYDETAGDAGRITVLYQGDDSGSGSDDSYLLEILTESTGMQTPLSSLIAFATGGTTELPNGGETRPNTTTTRVKNANGKSQPGAAASDVSDYSDSVSTFDSSFSSSSSDDQSELVKKPRKKHKKSRGRSEEFVLDWAELTMDSLFGSLWTMEICGKSSEATETKKEQTSRKPAQSLCCFGTSVEAKDGGRNATGNEPPQEPLKEMLGQAVEGGSILVAATFDSLQNIATEMFEDPVEINHDEDISSLEDEPPSERQCCRVEKYVDNVATGETLTAFFVPAIDGDSHPDDEPPKESSCCREIEYLNNVETGETRTAHFVPAHDPREDQLSPCSWTTMERFFEHPRPVVFSPSSQRRDDAAWEVFREIREAKMTQNQNIGTLNWSTEADMPDDVDFASTDMAGLSAVERYVRNWCFIQLGQWLCISCIL